MTAFEDWVIGYLANSLWMVPMVFAAAWVAARAIRRLGAAAEHRVWVGALWIEALLPALQVRIEEVWLGLRALRLWHWGLETGGGNVRITMTSGVAHVRGGLQLPHGVIMAIVMAYVCAILYFTARLGWGLWKTWKIEREAEPFHGAAVIEQQRWIRHTREAGVADARLVSSAKVSGPATAGMLRPILIVPHGFFDGLEEVEIDALMAHECTHMRRRDFAKNVIYSVLALPVAYHPLLWATWSRLEQSREMVCDAIAAKAVAGRERYAKSLLRLAASLIDKKPATTIHAIGIFDANSLERRVMELMRRSEKTGWTLRAAMLAVCVTIGVATCASAMALRMDVGAEKNGIADKNQPHETMPVLISSVVPNYPKVTKEDRISGTCLVSVTVDEQGLPRNLQIKRSLRQEYDEKAIEAIQKYRFKPATRDGQPVAKDLLIEVDFRSF